MSSSAVLRHARRLSTTAAAAAAGGPKPISISMAKYKLRAEHDPDKALEIYTSVSSHSTSPLSSRYAQHLTIKRLARSQRFKDIETLIETHKKDPQIKHEPFLSNLIRSYGIAGMPEHALGMYNEMEELGTPRTSVSFNALLSACVESKNLENVPKVFDEMPKRFGFSPDKFSYGILVKAYCGLGRVDLAMRAVVEMEKEGIEVTSVTYTTLLSGLQKMGKVEEVKEVWDEMVEKGCVVDVAAYNVRLMGVANPDEVKGLIEEMKEQGLTPDTISFNYLMTCYCKYGMMKEARRVYEDLESNGCKPNAATFRTLVFHYSRFGDFDKAYEVFKKSVEVHKIPDFNTLKHLVKGLVGKSKMKEAKGMCRTVKKKFPASFLHCWGKLEEELGLSVKHSSGPKKIESFGA